MIFRLNRLTKQPSRLAALLLVMLAGNLFLTAQVQAATSDQVAAFRKLWSRTDNLVDDGVVSRSWVWGPKPLSYDYTDQYRYTDNGPVVERALRHYDKGRMEIDPRQTPDSKWYIRGGTLVKELVEGRLQVNENGAKHAINPLNVATPADIPVVGDPVVTEATPTYATFTDYASLYGGNRRPEARGQSVTKLINHTADTVQYNSNDPKAKIVYYENVTGHNVPQAFMDYFARQGLVQDSAGNQVKEPLFDPLYVFGFPITEPYWARVQVGGKTTLVMLQLFERRVLSYTPTNDPEWQVEMGNAGLHYLAWRNQARLAFQAAPRIGPAKFRSVLAGFNSPVTSQADDLYNTIISYGLDPAVALAFFVRESGAGTAVGYCNGQNSLDNKNWGNVRGEEDGACGFQKFPTWKAGLATWCRLMMKYYVNKGLNYLEKAVPVYAPTSDGNDTNEYLNSVYTYVLRWQGYSV